MNMTTPTYICSGGQSVRQLRRVALLSWLALSFCAGCSLQDFDYLTNGAEGGKPTLDNVGGASPTDLGGATSQGGGIAEQGGSTAATGGVAHTGGSAAGGASLGPCPMYLGTGGNIMTPPSNDFDSDTSGWAMISQTTWPISLVSGVADACTGSSYMECDGSGRLQSWDGPAINVFPYLVANHKYVVTLAARFSPKSAPSSGSAIMMLSQVVVCTDTTIAASYTHIGQQSVSTTWTRFSGTLTTALAGCNILSSTGVYVETEAAAAANTIDVDNFELIDVTTTSIGTGGASSAGGAPATGGAAATGGVSATGGAAAAGSASSQS